MVKVEYSDLHKYPSKLPYAFHNKRFQTLFIDQLVWSKATCSFNSLPTYNHILKKKCKNNVVPIICNLSPLLYLLNSSHFKELNINYLRLYLYANLGVSLSQKANFKVIKVVKKGDCPFIWKLLLLHFGGFLATDKLILQWLKVSKTLSFFKCKLPLFHFGGLLKVKTKG